MQLQDRVDQLNRLRQKTETLRGAMFATMESGGYIDTIESAGPDFDRVRSFIASLRDPIPPFTVKNIVSRDFLAKPNPWVLPMFPGLTHQPFHDPAEFPWVTQLQDAFLDLKQEAEASLTRFRTSTYGEITQEGGRWFQGHASALGTLDTRVLEFPLPVLLSLARDLPGCCAAELGTADAFYSLLEAGASINTHTSSDNLKVRFHLGLKVPEGQCALNVGGQTNSWEEGKVLILEDAYLHMAWNRTEKSRMVALIDFWHPDLTMPERAALSAAFKKSEMRRMICYARAVPDELSAKLMDLFVAEDSNPTIAQYWPTEPTYRFQFEGRITD